MSPSSRGGWARFDKGGETGDATQELEMSAVGLTASEPALSTAARLTKRSWRWSTSTLFRRVLVLSVGLGIAVTSIVAVVYIAQLRPAPSPQNPGGNNVRPSVVVGPFYNIMLSVVENGSLGVVWMTDVPTNASHAVPPTTVRWACGASEPPQWSIIAPESVLTRPLLHEGAAARVSMHHHALLGEKAAQCPPAPLRYQVITAASENVSDVFVFQKFDDPSERFLVWGDMGLVGGLTAAAVNEHAQRQRWTLGFALGDFAYSLQDEDGAVGDMFLQLLQPSLTSTPFLSLVGNHEVEPNDHEYRGRMLTPCWSATDGAALWYSVNTALAHIVVISTEEYYLPNGSVEQQYAWLAADLEHASSTAERQKRPWIVVLGHRPLYCSGRTCPTENPVLNTGPFNLEDLFNKHQVNLYLSGHKHFYERTSPVFRDKIAGDYGRPTALVQVVAGNAGNPGGPGRILKQPSRWSAFLTQELGFGHLSIFNASVLCFEAFDVTGAAVMDSFFLHNRVHV